MGNGFWVEDTAILNFECWILGDKGVVSQYLTFIPIHFTLKNSSKLTHACFRIALNVPSGKSVG